LLPFFYFFIFLGLFFVILISYCARHQHPAPIPPVGRDTGHRADYHIGNELQHVGESSCQRGAGNPQDQGRDGEAVRPVADA